MIRKAFYLLTLAFFLLFTFNQNHAQTPLADLLSDELNREFKVLKEQDIPLYYLAYRVTEIQSVSIQASFGNITARSNEKSRILDISLRVGDHTLDNTHETEDNFMMFNGGFSMDLQLPVEDNDRLIRHRLWEATDTKYKNAVSSYQNIKSKSKKNNKGQDFSFEKAFQYEEPSVGNIEHYFEAEKWEKRLRNYTRPFLNAKEFLDGSAELNFEIQKKYFVSSEGSRIIQNQCLTRLVLSGQIVSEDGDVIPLEEVLYTEFPKDLPSHDSIVQLGKNLAKDLILLRKAPKAEPYRGPAILSAGAAGVFFHEIFGHRIEGARLRQKSDGQTFKEKLGKSVLNKNLSVYSDPRVKTYNNKYLAGNYEFDDEGMPAQKVTVIKEGILKNFLMSRKPVGELKHSNGHGRAAAGSNPVTRQSNLFVVAKKSYNEEKLRKMLIRKCKKQGLEYGYYIEKVAGGFTTTDRYMPNAFNIMPRKVYKIFTDGRPDELVRGVNLIGTPLVMFSEIEAAGDTPDVFSGMCGAESGSIPVSTVTPALLVNKIETQKEPEQNQTLPILPKPGIKNSSTIKTK